MADRYSAEQYAAAGQWMLKNLGDPAAIKAKADELGLTIEELAAAAQTVNPELKVEDVVNYFKKLDKPADTPAPAPAPAPAPTERFTEEQYSNAGQWMLQNLGDPNAIKAKADELGLSTSELLTAAKTVNPELTTEDVNKYLNTSTSSTSTPPPALASTSTTVTQQPAQKIGDVTIPADWESYSDEKKIAWFNDNSISPGQLLAAGLPRETLDRMWASGYTIGNPNPPATTTKTTTDTATKTATDTATKTAADKAAADKAAADKAAADKAAADKATQARFSADQFKDAGQWMLKNLGDPTAIADKAKELGLTTDELLTAAKTVNPNLTTGDLSKYFQDALTQSKGSNFDTSVRGTPTVDRSGTGVAVTGESGLRAGYAPYVQRMLERASAEADVPFQKYTGESPLLESAKQGIANLTTPAQFLQGSNLAQAAGIGALNYGQYKPTAFTTGTFAAPAGGGASSYKAGSPSDVVNLAGENMKGQNFEYMRPPPMPPEAPIPKAYGGEIEGYDVGGAVDAGVNTTTNPYTVPANPNIQPVNYGGQNVTNVQASYMTPYMQNVVDVQQREAKRQADIANQAIGAKAAQAGAFGGARHGLMESEANRNLMTQLGGIQAKGLQDAYTQGLGQFNVEQGRGLEAQKMSEQSRQFGAELGLKGLQTGIQSAQALGNLGQQQGYLDLATLKQMADLGTADRNFDYNEFLRAEKYPYENLTFMKNMLTGLPTSAAATGIDPMSQALTGGISTVALIDMLNKIGTGSTGPTTTGTKP